jgi:ATP-dependent DNA helicase DinG
MNTLRELFGGSGALARAMDGFVPRPSQRRVAERIETALAEREVLLVEAGTGTGKTFAYLVPALLSGLRVLISTGTRTLQDQLYSRDIPLLSAALGRPRRVALLKGRANYLCRARFLSLETQRTFWPATRAAGGIDLRELQNWVASTRSGDLAEVARLGENDPMRAQLTSTRESCTGSKCAEYARCHVFAARRAAIEADIIVVNHHLLMADLALKEDGFGDLLPSVDALILDEAHQLPDLAAEFFGVDCSSRQIEMLLQDSKREAAAGVLSPTVAKLCLGPESALRQLRECSGAGERRIAWQDLPANAIAAVARLQAALGEFSVRLSELEAGVDLKQCGIRAGLIVQSLESITDVSSTEGARALAVSARGIQISLLPYDIAGRFSGMVKQRPSSWIFASATLALAGDFTHYAARLGLATAETLCVESPFDFENQSLLYLPEGMPDPSTSDYTIQVIKLAMPLIEAAMGGAFLLFTSHRALTAAATFIRTLGLSYPLMVQGEAPREHLLRQFRESGRAVLLGTASFWEGVDVQGAALRLVMIDRLPFSHVDDPLVRARVEYLESQGGNPFRDYQLPEAAMALKQGVGRLIRSESDRGVVVICDPRLISKGYGKSLLKALPPMARTRDLAVAESMLHRCARELPLAWQTPPAPTRLHVDTAMDVGA